MSANLRAVRIAKIEKLQAKGIKPYPDRFVVSHHSTQALALPLDTAVSLAGRIMLIRVMGKLTFAHLQDAQGRIQIALSQDEIGRDHYKTFTKLVDIGDFIGVTGKIFRTKTGEQSVLVQQFTFLGKSLRPLPEKHHSIKDRELCYRQRYLDLLMNPDTRTRFRQRARIIRLLRDYLEQHNFEEVDTPVLQTKPSGALATPFVTHHHALDIDLYLRIAPETYLKRLIVGGFERVYEFARVFRNEGMDPSHLQDFTILEYYVAYWNFQDNMAFTADLLKHVIAEVNGSLVLDYKGQRIDFGGEWPRISLRDIILQQCELDIAQLNTAEALRQAVKAKGIELERWEVGWGNLVDQLYKKTCRPKIIQPHFLMAHPIELSPLARRNDEQPHLTDRFQLVVNGWEIVNAYSELVDPLEQRQRLEEQARLNAAGDAEAMVLDEDYLMAMEYGMPPISGWGMGIERFVALLTNQENLRDVVLFPLMKPLDQHEEVTAPEEQSISDIGISPEQAQQLFEQHVTSDNLRKHCRATAMIMAALAPRYNADPQVWSLVGLLHDLDFDHTKEPSEHTVLAAQLMRAAGVHPEIIRTIQSHNAEHVGVPRRTTLDFALSCAEMITGLIVATALVYPDKKLASVKVKSILKRMKKKDFARKVDRGQIMLCEKIGLSLEEFCALSLQAMQAGAGELGL